MRLRIWDCLILVELLQSGIILRERIYSDAWEPCFINWPVRPQRFAAVSIMRLDCKLMRILSLSISVILSVRWLLIDILHSPVRISFSLPRLGLVQKLRRGRDRFLNHLLQNTSIPVNRVNELLVFRLRFRRYLGLLVYLLSVPHKLTCFSGLDRSHCGRVCNNLV